MTRARELGKLANTNILTADTTNNFVGIASTQPTTRLDVVGVVSATSFSGDGSSLTGVASTDNIITGTAATFTNVVKVGTAITLDATSGIITAVNGFVGNVTGNATGLSGTPDITIRNVTGVAATFTGILTYDDVTNVDSVGIITARAGVKVPDSQKIFLGTGDDLQIYHSGSHSFIKDSGTGNLYINSNNVVITNAADNESLASFIENGAVELYYDNDLHFATTADGCKTNGDLSFRGDGDVEQILFDASDASLKFTDSKKAKFGTGDDLQIYHDGTNSTIANTTGDLYITDSGGNIYIQSKAGEQSIVAFADGAVDLYHNNSKKLETTSDGVTVTGTIDGQTELRTWLFG